MKRDNTEKHLRLVLNNIRKLREVNDLTREAIADELGITRGGYGKLEKGDIQMSVKRLLLISKLLNTKPETFFKEGLTSNLNLQEQKDYTLEEGYTENLKEKGSDLYILHTYIKILELRIRTLEEKFE